jgi:DNA excision repair protein ERCC-2
MELAIVAGIPYPKPTAKQRAFQHFCEVRFGHGWEHAVKAPTARRLQQAIGRLIRSETDRGAAVVLDRRAVHFQDTLCASRTDSPVDDVLGFFAREPALAQLKAEVSVPRARRGMQL